MNIKFCKSFLKDFQCKFCRIEARYTNVKCQWKNTIKRLKEYEWKNTIKNPVQDSFRDFVDCIYNSNAILYCYCPYEIYVCTVCIEYSWYGVVKMECLFTLLFRRFTTCITRHFLKFVLLPSLTPRMEIAIVWTWLYTLFMFLYGLN